MTPRLVGVCPSPSPKPSETRGGVHYAGLRAWAGARAGGKTRAGARARARAGLATPTPTPKPEQVPYAPRSSLRYPTLSGVRRLAP